MVSIKKLLIENNLKERLKMNKSTAEMIRSGVIGAVMGFIMSFLMNYFFVPVPETTMANA
jgi:riboflavin transporter FmnP